MTAYDHLAGGPRSTPSPATPDATVRIRPDATAEVSYGGASHALEAVSLEEARRRVVAYFATQAGSLGREVQVRITEPQGQWLVAVGPGGDVREMDERSAGPAAAPDDTTRFAPIPAPRQAPAGQVPPPPPPRPQGTSTPTAVPPVPRSPAAPPQVIASFAPPPGTPQRTGSSDLPEDTVPPLRRRELRESFLTTKQTEAPATTGLRGTLARMGLRTAPSAAERSERADVNAVSQHWPGVRTIAVVNGKGGANKTPTTALLAAVFARHSGAATLAWDNNETRGTLGWRTEQGTHEGTVLDLIPRIDELLAPSARAGDISHYVHHQARDKYDVLRSNPHLISAEERITAEDVDRIHDVAGRYYRLILVDSGNDESAAHWLRMVDKADQLVVATIAKPEHAEAGALLLEALTQRDARSADLARRAVVVVSQAREKDANPAAAEIASGFRGWVRETVTIPFDPAMVESVLHYDALRPATRRAWLRAGAAVAAGL